MVCTAWMQFPSATLEPLEQVYRRLDARTYHYAATSADYATDQLTVNSAGFVARYPGLWQAIAEAHES